MSKQIIATVLVVAGLLAAYVWFTEPPPEKEPGASWGVPSIEQFDRLELTRGSETLLLEQDSNGRWHIREPLEFGVNERQMESVVELFTGEDRVLLVDNEKDATPANLLRYGFDEGAEEEDLPMRVTVFDAGTAATTFAVGSTDDAQSGARRTWVLPEGSETIYRLNRDLRRVLDKDLAEWRNRDVLVLDDDQQEALNAIDISYSEQNLRLERQPGEEGEDDEWTLVEPADTPFDTRLLASFVRQVDTVNADDFADELSPSDAGLDEPSHSITLHLGDSEQYSLRFGHSLTTEPEDEDAIGEERRYVQVDNGPIFQVRARTAANLTKRLGDFLPRDLLELERDDIASITINDAEAGLIELYRNAVDEEDEDAEITWRMREPERVNPVEQNPMRRMLSNVADVQARRFADEHVTPELAGLDAPVRVITYTMDDDTQHVLELGGPVEPLGEDDEPDNVDRFARLDAGAIIELRNHKVRPLMTSVTDLAGSEEETDG